MRHERRFGRASGLVGFLGALAGASLPLGKASAAESPGIVRLARQQRAIETTGQLRDVDVDRARVEIAAAPPLGTIKERTAPEIPRRPLRRVGTLDRKVLAAEIRAQIADAELCRFKVAQAAGIPPADVKAGELTLHWTIQTTGETRGTLVFEGTETDLALMKCVRRRMNGWRFSKPSGGPVDVEYDYRFASVSGDEGRR